MEKKFHDCSSQFARFTLNSTEHFDVLSCPIATHFSPIPIESWELESHEIVPETLFSSVDLQSPPLESFAGGADQSMLPPLESFVGGADLSMLPPLRSFAGGADLSKMPSLESFAGGDDLSSVSPLEILGRGSDLSSLSTLETLTRGVDPSLPLHVGANLELAVDLSATL